jgi:hypothetical protein
MYKHNTTLTTLRDKNLAIDHYKSANSGFDKNIKLYSDQLNQKMKKQDSIYNMTLGAKFQTHTIDQMIKDNTQNRIT